MSRRAETCRRPRAAALRRRTGRRPGRVAPKSAAPGVAVARKSLSKPLKRLKMGSDMARRAETCRRPRAAALRRRTGRRPGRIAPKSAAPGVAVARKILSKPLKRLKTGSRMSRRAETGRRPGPTPRRPKVSDLGIAAARNCQAGALRPAPPPPSSGRSPSPALTRRGGKAPPRLLPRAAIAKRGRGTTRRVVEGVRRGAPAWELLSPEKFSPNP